MERKVVCGLIEDVIRKFSFSYPRIVRLCSFTLSTDFLKKIHLHTYSDAVSTRTLSNEVNIPAGTTAESCAAACQAAGGFTYAALENGHECCG